MPNTVSFYTNKFFGSPTVLKMPAYTRWLYMYVVNSPLKSCSGVFTLPITQICFHTGLTENQVKVGLKDLDCKFKRIVYDFENETIFVFNAFKLMPKTKEIKTAVFNDFKYNNVSARIKRTFLNVNRGSLNDGMTILTDYLTLCLSDTDITDLDILEPETKKVSLDGFEDFWKPYPKKIDKPDAKEAWRKLNPDKPLQEKILKGLQSAISSEEWVDRKFIPHPKKFLNKRRWENEFTPKSQTNIDKFHQRQLAQNRIGAHYPAAESQKEINLEEYTAQMTERERDMTGDPKAIWEPPEMLKEALASRGENVDTNKD